MTYSEIVDTWEDLPRADGSHMQERIWFDLKRTYSPKSQHEMAKDVAAFANASGGVLIVGADEGVHGPDYGSPLSVEYAKRIETEFDQAVREFCRPSPTIHIRTIPVPAQPEMVILAVNVEPTIDQPVAARYGADPNAWRFPQRIGRHTEFILPEHLPLFMNSKARRAKLLLLRAGGKGGEIDLFTIPGGTFKRGDIQAPTVLDVIEVDSEGSGSFTVRDKTGQLGTEAVSIPFDDVEAIWKQHSGRWAVRLSGRLELFLHGNDIRELAYVPPGTFVASPIARTIEDMSKRLTDLGRILRGTLSVEQRERPEPKHEAIQTLAYSIWIQRTRNEAPGTANDDWIEARRLLLERR